jgi:glycosyltransferase involved in cell wall biosynthesis
MKASLSVFFPAYNDAATIGGLVEKTFHLLQAVDSDFEVIVIDDGSVDETPQILERLLARYGEAFRVVRHPANRGYGAALRSGFAAATKELVFYTDGDGQFDPGELPLLLARMEPHIGLVNGYKIARQDPWYRILLGEVYNAVVRRAFRIGIRDVDCDFRLIRRELLVRTRLRSDSGCICVELLQQLQELGCGMAEVPVHHYPRIAGRSQFFRLSSVANTLRQLASLYRLRQCSAPPLAALSEKSAEASRE